MEGIARSGNRALQPAGTRPPRAGGRLPCIPGARAPSLAVVLAFDFAIGGARAGDEVAGGAVAAQRALLQSSRPGRWNVHQGPAPLGPRGMFAGCSAPGTTPLLGHDALAERIALDRIACVLECA